jgi:hypothetical protein
MLPALAAEGCIEDSQTIPQGLKPISFWAACGTAEAVPFQNNPNAIALPPNRFPLDSLGESALSS